MSDADILTAIQNGVIAVNNLNSYLARLVPFPLALAANTTYYVRSDGSDGNNGLTNSPGGAFLTWARAVAVVTGTLNFNGFTVTIFNGDAATYATSIAINSSWIGSGALVIDLGGGSIGVNAVRTTALIPTSITVQNGTIGGILHSGVGLVQVGSNVTFGPSAGRHLQATSPGSYLSASFQTYTVSGNAQFHTFAADQGRIDRVLSTVNFTNNVAFTTFAFAERLAEIIDQLTVFNLGAFVVTGQRYNVILNSLIDTNGGGALYFPGTVAGAVATGGTYN